VPVLGHQVARETRRFDAWEPCPDAHPLGRVVPLRDRRAELVQGRERASVRVWHEEAYVLEAIGEELGDPQLEGIEALACVRGDEERARVRVLDAPPAERIERLHLVQHELHRNVVGSDLAEDAGHGGDRLRELFFGQRRVRNVQDEVGHERLLERGRETFHQLSRQAADEADRVGDEVALPVVLECARGRVEGLEKTVVDGGVRAGERVQEGRLADVRIAGERDRGSRCAQPLLATGRPLTLQPTEAPLEERDTRARDTAVGLQLCLARPSGPHSAPEALEVFPHAAHAREVVLELRELDLELALRAPRMLGEDVEDELRPVDDARAELVLQRALLRGSELVVGEEHLRGGRRIRRLQLPELPLADERARVRATAMLDDLTHGHGARGPRELPELGKLDRAVRALRVHADEERTLRLRPWCGIGLARSHREIMPRYAPAVTALADRLAARTLELVDIPSQSGHEDAIRERLLELVPRGWAPEYTGDEAFLFAPPRRQGSPLIVLVAHYDTVPAQDNLPGRIAECAVHGLGASDMKGGLAVALELSRDVDPGSTASDLALLLFGREELPAEHNPLPALFEGSALVHETTLAVVLEPTDLTIQAGCLGNVVARLIFHGTSGHAARPWLADSALERAARGLVPLFELPARTAIVNGFAFQEVVSVTGLHAGIADNVIPGEAVATLTLRYPPDRGPSDAEDFLAGLVPDGATLEVLSNAPPARVVDSPAVRALQRAGGLEVGPKQAWTNVADFTSRGLDAVNFGPGHTAYAHHPAERVAIDALVTAYEVLGRFLSTPIGEDAA
jgi:succinyl-diaminopimelate desuccinylase